MIPEDDPTWPDCSQHPDHAWCNERMDYLRFNSDAASLTTGMRYCVPIVPTLGMFAEVGIENEIMPGAAPMYLVRSVPYTQDEVLIQIGMWSKGEGRLSMADVLSDWLRGQNNWDKDLRCPNSSHGWNEAQELSRQKDEPWKKGNAWCIVMYQMCIPCYVKYQAGAQQGNFGINTTAVPPDRRSENQQNLMNQLRNK